LITGKQSPVAKPVLKLQLDIGKGKTGTIVVRQGDNPLVLAKNFAKTFNLKPEYIAVIEAKIREQLFIHFTHGTNNSDQQQQQQQKNSTTPTKLTYAKRNEALSPSRTAAAVQNYQSSSHRFTSPTQSAMHSPRTHAVPLSNNNTNNTNNNNSVGAGATFTSTVSTLTNENNTLLKQLNQQLQAAKQMHHQQQQQQIALHQQQVMTAGTTPSTGIISNSNPLNSPRHRSGVLFNMDIEIGNNKTARLAVHEGADPKSLARSFAIIHNLKSESEQSLVNIIKHHMLHSANKNKQS